MQAAEATEMEEGEGRRERVQGGGEDTGEKEHPSLKESGAFARHESVEEAGSVNTEEGCEEEKRARRLPRLPLTRLIVSS